MTFPEQYQRALSPVRYSRVDLGPFVDKAREETRATGHFDHTHVGVMADALEEAGDPRAPIFRRHYDNVSKWGPDEYTERTGQGGRGWFTLVTESTGTGSRPEWEDVHLVPYARHHGREGVMLSWVRSPGATSNPDAYHVTGHFTNAEARKVIEGLGVPEDYLTWFDRQHPS